MNNKNKSKNKKQGTGKMFDNLHYHPQSIEPADRVDYAISYL